MKKRPSMDLNPLPYVYDLLASLVTWLWYFAVCLVPLNIKVTMRLTMNKKNDNKAAATKTSVEKSKDVDNSGVIPKLMMYCKKGKTVLSDQIAELIGKSNKKVPQNGGLNSKRYVGLRNQGNTCYLNSLLQCLYHTPKFKEKLFTNISNKTYLAVNKIFHELDDMSDAVNTHELTESLGLSSYKQQDVPEIFHLLLNALDGDTTEGSYFKEVFWSTMVNLMQCKECCAEDGFQTATKIAVLPLAVAPTQDEKQPWSVTSALEQFQKINYMTEENQIYCSACRKKTDMTLRQTFGRLPPVLVVQLKRFEYRFRSNSFAKLHNEVSIDKTLEVQYDAEKPWEKKSYELFAICDHHGEFWGGHYTAIIKPEGSNKWYRFNDSSVNVDDRYGFSSSRTAYLLMYREQSVSDPDKNKSVLVSQGPVDGKVWNDQTKKLAISGQNTEDDKINIAESNRSNKLPLKTHVDHGADPRPSAENATSMNSDLPHEIQIKCHNDLPCTQKTMQDTGMQEHSIGVNGDPFPNSQTSQVDQNSDQTMFQETFIGGNGEIETMSTSTTTETSEIYKRAFDAQTRQEEGSSGGAPNTQERDLTKSETSDINEQVSDAQTPQKECSSGGACNAHITETMPTTTIPQTSAISKQSSDLQTLQKEGSPGGAPNAHETDTKSTSTTLETSTITKQVSDTQTLPEECSAGEAPNVHETQTVLTSTIPEASAISKQLSDCQTPQIDGFPRGAPSAHETNTVTTSMALEASGVTDQVTDTQTSQKECSAGGAPNAHERDTVPTSKTHEVSDITEHVSEAQLLREEFGDSNAHETATKSISTSLEASGIKASDAQTPGEDCSAGGAPKAHCAHLNNT